MRHACPLIAAQAGRCMDLRHPVLPQRLSAGKPDPGVERLVWRDDWRDALDRLHATNNFPPILPTDRQLLV